MNWEIILTIIASLGGAETIKWMLTRRSHISIAQSEADEKQFEVYRAQIEQLHHTISTLTEREKELIEINREKEQRFVEQTTRLRNVQDENEALHKQLLQAEVELIKKRCDDLPCPFRLPPNAYTPAPTNETKEQHAAKRNQTHT